MKTPQTRTGNQGRPYTAKAAVLDAARNGWTPKEAAWETGWPLKRLYKVSSTIKVSMGYGGRGPKPQWIAYGPDAN